MPIDDTIYNEAEPNGAVDTGNLLDSAIQATKKTIRTCLDREHDFNNGTSFTVATSKYGRHKHISLVDPGATVPPITAADLTTNGADGVLYSDAEALYWHTKSNILHPVCIHYPDHFVEGLELVYDSATGFSVQPGTCVVNKTRLKSTAAISFTSITTAGDYFEGSPVAGADWIYIYVYNNAGALGIKLSLSEPQYADESSNTVGLLRYRKISGTPDVWYRCIGAIKTDATPNILKFYQTKNYIQYDTFITLTASATASAEIPAISTLGNFYLEALTAVNYYAQISIRPAGSSGSYLQMGSTSPEAHEGYYNNTYSCMTNSSQQIALVINKHASATATCKTVGYWINIL